MMAIKVSWLLLFYNLRDLLFELRGPDSNFQRCWKIFCWLIRNNLQNGFTFFAVYSRKIIHQHLFNLDPKMCAKSKNEPSFHVSTSMGGESSVLTWKSCCFIISPWWWKNVYFSLCRARYWLLFFLFSTMNISWDGREYSINSTIFLLHLFFI